MVIHSRASDPMVNLVKEAPGIAKNESFWKFVDRLYVPQDKGIRGAVYAVAGQLIESKDPYYTHYGRCLEAWLRILQSVDR